MIVIIRMVLVLFILIPFVNARYGSESADPKSKNQRPSGGDELFFVPLKFRQLSSEHTALAAFVSTDLNNRCSLARELVITVLL
jgi:hypothetical protein